MVLPLTRFCGSHCFVSLDKTRLAWQNVLTRAVESQGLVVAGWRDVPVDLRIVGDIARESLPAFKQILVNCPAHMDGATVSCLWHGVKQRFYLKMILYFM